MPADVPTPAAAIPGAIVLREPGADLPDPNIQPPTVAEAGDPFAALRVIDMVARLEPGTPVLLRDVAAALNAAYLDWFFSPEVVADVVVQLHSNWMTDYRNASGIDLDDGPYGPQLLIERSSRVDPWLAGQAARAAAACREALHTFSRQERPGSDD